MKAKFFCALGAAAMLMTTGCLGPKVNNNGFPSAPPGFLYSEMQTAQMVDMKMLPAHLNYTVLKRVKAEAVTTSFCGLISTGDASYATLKAKALQDCREADDIIDLEVDSVHSNILGLVNKVTTVIRGVAIKYNSQVAH